MSKENTGVFLGTLLLVSVLMYACDSTVQPGNTTPIEQQWENFVLNWNNMNPDETVAIYTENAILIPPDMEILRGRDSIQEFYAGLFSMNRSANYVNSTKSIEISGNQAIEFGEFKVDWISEDGRSWTYHARVLVHWTRQSGNWRIEKLMFNSPPSGE